MKTALITGGSRGIGLEAVRRFQKAGYAVITCGRVESTWRKNLEEVPELKNVIFITTDLSDNEQLGDLFSRIKVDYGNLNIAVNNASPLITSLGNFSGVETANLFATLINDFWAPALCIKKELELMNSGASIVNISSVNGLRPAPYSSMYSVAKHGLEGLTKSIALEATEKGIRVNSVAPGVTWTPRWKEREKSDSSIREKIEAMVPLRRFAEASEIVDAIEWLCSEKARYIVGHTLVVDGGLSLK